ncbi:MAG: hypothetical protein IPK19_10955 [Chloroflexi bacterium]|nr:hypothetical protein [Chloroflexota bacterium]
MTHDDLRTREVTDRMQTTNSDGAVIDRYQQRLDAIMAQGIDAVRRDEDLQDELLRIADWLTERLRWERRFGEGIELQERLIPFLPDAATSLRAVAAALRIMSGSELDGFRELRDVAEQDSGNAWGWITLGSNYLWAGQLEAAEKVLLHATTLEPAESDARASAHHMLFKLYGMQKRVDEAVTSWQEAVQLDPDLEATLPDLLRTLIYWYHYDTAERYLHRERNEVRRLFYGDLINVKRSRMLIPNSWEWVTRMDPKTLDEAYEEFAEASLRFVRPQLALDALQPLLDRGEISRRRLALAGLAWAQQRMLDRARWALDLALRAGDLEFPRGTRRSVGGRRILDSETRVLYGEIVVDPDIREEIDRYFMPVVNSD